MSAQIIKKIKPFIEKEDLLLSLQAIVVILSLPRDNVCTSQPHTLFL
jgi:hypothetical protein